MFNGQTLNMIDDFGQPVTDDTFLIVLNSSDQNVPYTLPPPPNNSAWEVVLNTAQDKHPFQSGNAAQQLEVAGRSVVVLKDRQSYQSSCRQHSYFAVLARVLPFAGDPACLVCGSP